MYKQFSSYKEGTKLGGVKDENHTSNIDYLSCRGYFLCWLFY